LPTDELANAAGDEHLQEYARGAAARNKSEQKLERHRAAIEQREARHGAFQDLLKSEDIRQLVKALDPGLRRTFDFFTRWKGDGDGTMTLAGFLYLGDCFGFLNKESLKFIFRHLGGRGVAFEQFPEALLFVAMRVTETAIEDQKVNLTEERVLWAKNFRALCLHMLLTKPKDLQKCLDNYRKQEESHSRNAPADRLPKFEPPAVAPVQGGAVGANVGASGVDGVRAAIDNDVLESTLLKGSPVNGEESMAVAVAAANAAEAAADATEALAGWLHVGAVTPTAGGSVTLIEDTKPVMDADVAEKVAVDEVADAAAAREAVGSADIGESDAVPDVAVAADSGNDGYADTHVPGEAAAVKASEEAAASVVADAAASEDVINAIAPGETVADAVGGDAADEASKVAAASEAAGTMAGDQAVVSEAADAKSGGDEAAAGESVKADVEGEMINAAVADAAVIGGPVETAEATATDDAPQATGDGAPAAGDQVAGEES
jgi:hypothetical protein